MAIPDGPNMVGYQRAARDREERRRRALAERLRRTEMVARRAAQIMQEQFGACDRPLFRNQRHRGRGSDGFAEGSTGHRGSGARIPRYRSIYATHLDPSRMEDLVIDLPEVWLQTRREIKTFAGFLYQLTYADQA
jgi:hypothetical protein